MTETRKQIIELIEPFMDKTLSEGCYWINIYTEDRIEQVISEVRWWNFYSLIDWFKTHFPHITQIKKILWHYDITAVFKYIEDKYELDVVCYWDAIDIYYKFSDIWFGEIPNKPLHLYTESEERALLKLLQQLWK